MNDEIINDLSCDIKNLFQNSFSSYFVKVKKDFVQKWPNLYFLFLQKPLSDIYQPNLYFDSQGEAEEVLKLEKDKAIKYQNFELAHFINVQIKEGKVRTMIDIFTLSFEIQFVNNKICIAFNTNLGLFYEKVMNL